MDDAVYAVAAADRPLHIFERLPVDLSSSILDFINAVHLCTLKATSTRFRQIVEHSLQHPREVIVTNFICDNYLEELLQAAPRVVAYLTPSHTPVKFNGEAPGHRYCDTNPPMSDYLQSLSIGCFVPNFASFGAAARFIHESYPNLTSLDIGLESVFFAHGVQFAFVSFLTQLRRLTLREDVMSARWIWNTQAVDPECHRFRELTCLEELNLRGIHESPLHLSAFLNSVCPKNFKHFSFLYWNGTHEDLPTILEAVEIAANRFPNLETFCVRPICEGESTVLPLEDYHDLVESVARRVLEKLPNVTSLVGHDDRGALPFEFAHNHFPTDGRRLRLKKLSLNFGPLVACRAKTFDLGDSLENVLRKCPDLEEFEVLFSHDAQIHPQTNYCAVDHWRNLSRAPPLLHYLPSIRASNVKRLRKLSLRCAHVTEELADLRELCDVRLRSCRLGDIVRLSNILAALPRLRCLTIASPVDVVLDDEIAPSPAEVARHLIEPLKLSQLVLHDCWGLSRPKDLYSQVSSGDFVWPTSLTVTSLSWDEYDSNDDATD